VHFRIVWDSAELRSITVQDRAAVVLHTTVFPITDAGGKVTHAVFQHVDVTKLTHTEREKSRLESQLLQAQKMESIGRLAGGIAHDFNNMLLVIQGYAELLEANLAGNGVLLPYAVEIRQAAERSADITRQLLAFSRKQIIEPRVMDLNSLMQSLRSTMARLIGEDIELRITAAADLWRIRADRSQMSQILLNLAANARDALPTGGHLYLETSNLLLSDEDCRERIDVQPGRYVKLTVTDDGIGMDREILAHLFEPFFTTKATGQGTGLGLATVYGIVTQNGGAIAVDSEPGRGTSFRVILPATEAPLDEASETLAPPPRGEAILLVEDDEPVRIATASMLEAIGYRVRAAGSPQEALSLCAEQDFDLVLMDVVMQSMTGVELSERLARLRPSLAVLFMSGYTEEAMAHRGLAELRWDLLTKPFSMQTLSQRVGEAIRRSRQRASE
jgi:signal transduction histidine kinase/CheY-like chemotaxis protein